jgi:hypothetical protein
VTVCEMPPCVSEVLAVARVASKVPVQRVAENRPRPPEGFTFIA